MTRHNAIREETRRYLDACNRHATHLAHIHALALGRLRGQPVAAWIRSSDVPPVPMAVQKGQS